MVKKRTPNLYGHTRNFWPITLAQYKYFSTRLDLLKFNAYHKIGYHFGL